MNNSSHPRRVQGIRLARTFRLTAGFRSAQRFQSARRARLALAIALAGAALAAPFLSLAPSALAAPLVRQAGAAPAHRAAASATTPTRAFFGLGPASATAIDGRPYFSWAATPNAALGDHVAIVNFGTVPVTLNVFAANAVSLAKGGTGFQSRGQSHGGLASWITLHFPHNSSTLSLPPHSKVIVPITLVVPKNATPGDHVGAIIASLTSTIVSKNHAKVHLVQQVAARVILRISGRLRPLLTVADLRVSYDNKLNPTSSGVASLHFTVQNSGNELLGGKPQVEIQGLFGTTEVAAHPVLIPIMLPGGSDSESVTIPGVYPQLLMNAKVTITPTVATGQYDTGLSKYSATKSFWAIPTILLIIVVVLILLAGWWIWRHRRRRTGPVGDAAPVPSGVGA
jgi:hypothetical protein